MRMTILKLDDEFENDMRNGLGFIIDTPISVTKKELIRNPKGIYSSLFGGDISDVAEVQKRYSCACGETFGKFQLGYICPKCHQPVVFHDNELQRTGWMELKEPYYVINPRMFEFIKSAIKSKRLDEILKFDKQLNEHGMIVDDFIDKKKNPYANIGMIEFKNRFDEIIDALGDKKKADTIQFLHDHKDLVFSRHIPVLTLLLRPVVLIGNSTFNYDPINKYYSEMVSDVYYINNNKDDLETYNNLPILYELQKSYIELSDKIIVQKINGKKQAIRSFILGSRINFSARHVLTGNTDSVRLDGIVIPYITFTTLYKYHIMNIYKRLYNVTINELEDRWYTLVMGQDPSIMNIINILIHKTPGGLKMYSNRNPTIAYGSTTCQTIIGINEDMHDLTEALTLSILKLMNADFDGDTLNDVPIIEKSMADKFNEAFSPERMVIDPSTGKFNRKIGCVKDQLVGLYSFCNDDNDDDELDDENDSFSIITPRMLQERDAYFSSRSIA
jgi:DNA-directed RNA polymerase beta' subunit